MTIYDIAKLAGVSIATVSRVVNGSPKVSEKTKETVRRVMAETNYTPNAFARGLGLGTMQTVGIVCPDVADPYMAKAVSYLEKNLQGYGYDCILYCSGYDDADREQAVSLLLKKQLDALLLVGSIFSDEQSAVLTQLREAAARIPIFLINGVLSGDNVYCVLGDDYQAVYDVTEELVLAGKRRILFLTNSSSYSAGRKQQGYEAALAAHQLDVDARLILHCENSIPATRDLLLRQRGLTFDSVIATEDGMAVGALKYAAVCGLRVPDELSVVGYNNSELSICCEPELTSVDNRGELLCRTTIDSLMALLDGQTIPKQQVIKCHLIKRASTDF